MSQKRPSPLLNHWNKLPGSHTHRVLTIVLLILVVVILIRLVS